MMLQVARDFQSAGHRGPPVSSINEQDDDVCYPINTNTSTTN